jgi:hypothetical protein
MREQSTGFLGTDRKAVVFYIVAASINPQLTR